MASSLSPSDIARLSRPAGQSFVRAVYAAALRAADPQGRTSEAILKDLGEDRVALQLLTRAATAPANTTTSGWASQLVSQATADFVSSLIPSAAGRLVNAGVRASVDRAGTLFIPGRTTNPTALAQTWVAEGAPSPVVQFGIGGATLGPMRKVQFSVVLTRETVAIGGEAVVGTLLRETAALTLEAALFSDATATSAKPAGILAGITAQTATSGGGDAALRGDLLALVGSVASGNVVLVANAKTALAIRLGAPFAELPIWVSSALADGVVVAIDPAAFVSAFGVDPRISASIEAVVHMDNETPLAVGTVGSPATIASPTRSAFQTDCIVIRVTLKAAFAIRLPGSVAWVTGATWD